MESRINPIYRTFAYLRMVIGNTPMVEIEYTWKGRPRLIYAKCEYYNHTGSTKDRLAHYILEHAYLEGRLTPGCRIVEATSGNTGISFAALGSQLGHPVTILAPDWIGTEAEDQIRGYGAELIKVSREHGGFLAATLLAESMYEKDGSCFLPRQFSNPLNIAVHKRTTAVELWEQLGRVNKIPDSFAAGVGTGGTVMGVGRFFKQQDKSIWIHPVEPLPDNGNRTASGEASHRIRGIADNFIPALIDLSELDNTYRVHDGDAIMIAQKLSTEIGLGAGISSGANFLGAVQSQNDLGDHAVAVTIFPDSNRKYLRNDLLKQEPVRETHLAPHIRFLSYRIMPKLVTSIL